MYSALVLVMSGLFKKVVLADSMAPIVNATFNDPKGRGALPLAIGAIAFSIQIYGDFSGYTDIARGIGRSLGIDILRNFDQPYLSRDITEFWRRWHISLSTWLRDYLYVPLGGNRSGEFSTYRNLLLTMLLGGLWHGAAWTFVFWGAMHGVLLAFERRRSRRRREGRRADVPNAHQMPAVLRTFAIVTFLWIFFRADTIGDAFSYIGGFADGLVGPRAGPWKDHLVLVAFMAAAMVAIDLVDARRRQVNALIASPAWLQGAFAGIAFVALIAGAGKRRRRSSTSASDRGGAAPRRRGQGDLLETVARR
jgi:D-alanyl-lipoteichoic acid acyltransferase DltB (MBOAT superfamily)